MVPKDVKQLLYRLLKDQYIQVEVCYASISMSSYRSNNLMLFDYMIFVNLIWYFQYKQISFYSLFKMDWLIL